VGIMANVLLVDDEPDFLFVMGRLLKKNGFDVSEATNGKGTLKKVKEVRPDAVLLDVMMADMSGWEVCRKLKNNPETKDVPIIMLTAKAENGNIKESFDYGGADWHVSKPFDSDLLFFILKLAVERTERNEIESKIKQAIERDRRMKKILNMINPKLLNYNYDFLDK
jgi:CheY-like chemotaxis protein